MDDGESPTPAPPQHEVTELLLAWGNGDGAAVDKLMPLVYAELHRLARRYMRSEQTGQTLQTTALVNEAYLRLIEQKRVSWQNRAHFFAISAQMMRRILVSMARARHAERRGGAIRPVPILEGLVFTPARASELVELDEALTALEQLDSRQSRVVEMRFFAGLSVEETAEALGVSVETVMRDWKRARAWLYAELTRAR